MRKHTDTEKLELNLFLFVTAICNSLTTSSVVAAGVVKNKWAPDFPLNLVRGCGLSKSF